MKETEPEKKLSAAERREKKRRQREEKQQAVQALKQSQDMGDMIAYIDENGNISDTPPDHTKREEVKASEIVLGIPKKEDTREEDPTREGFVTFFNDEKGYGFIKDAENHESYFVHISNAMDELKENNKVQFETEMGPRGPVAIKVQLIR